VSWTVCEFAAAILRVTVRFRSLKSNLPTYWGADKPLARPTSRCILFDGENISFNSSLVIYK
jgi:hypothetical protein